ncbi:phenylalanine--tRNA ligase subunit beta [Enterobacteriaceae endosymbiont of Neohaemonia nigricornis]|uniref:phenylalanine--tRNA ligase subunit beta n=1 Tax=Enterobacteriaceae endosymbiont of Neohaemonia nigricornis TaxID=2675792 RepID=UPI00144974C9|nr:phenylalanine--tRNA ligase subunit beta [Enterobacteriaceae endosymbiont of Neohaemonia nigricornis]QJC30310.1 phenylalanine--tRNA ligase subunit beta [Enterobacteriaceae endosymbiont of Neohaemonia nigricornis]
MIKFSELWLRKWIICNKKLQFLTDTLTMTGFELENIEYLYKKNIDNIIVGEILNINISDYNNNIYDIIIDIKHSKLKVLSCYNINYIKNMKVIIATKQSSLYKKLVQIPKYNFLLYSEGILCNKEILPLDYVTNYNKNYKIYLPNTAINGNDANSFLKFPDKVISINIPYNRHDCSHIMGLARDLSSNNNINFQIPYDFIFNKTPKINNIHIKLNKLQLKQYLYNYKYCFIKNLNLKNKLPGWLIEKLLISGISIINNNPLLNISNYILLELGYPIHFYDFNKITGNIYIQKNRIPCKVITHAQQEINIYENIITVCDEQKILSALGLMQNYDVLTNLKTTNIFIECMCFNTKYIQILSQKYYNFTNFTNLYIKGLDPYFQQKVMIRTINLITKIFGGQIYNINSININNIIYKNKIIKLIYSKIFKLLGFNIPIKEIHNILKKIHIKIFKKNIDYCDIQIPSWRFDINNIEDIIEDIIRIYGYNKIPNKLIKLPINHHQIKKKQLMAIFINLYHSININNMKNILINRGYYEVINYSFINYKMLSMFSIKNNFIKIINPISKDMSVMRDSLFYGLINNILYNQNRQQKNLRLFEYGICFNINNKPILLENIIQQYFFSGIVNGNILDNNWSLQNRKIDFYDVKGDIECILNQYNNIKFKKNNTIFFLHPHQSASIYLNNINIGYMGVVHPKIIQFLNIKHDTIFFELFCNKINNTHQTKIDNISNLPINRREISFIINKNILYDEIIQSLKNMNIKEVINIKLFDVYEGQNIPTGYKNITLSLIIQHMQYTLNDDKINGIIQQYVQYLKNKFNIILRDQY